jgi:PAS domain S-box-containing protein
MHTPSGSDPKGNSLEETNARLQGILEAALDCIVTIDHEGNVVEFNPAAERTFGYRAADVIGRNLGELIVPPRHRDRHAQGMRRQVESGESRMTGRRIEIEALRADGSEFLCELTITKLQRAGAPVFTAFLRDITQRKRAEAEIMLLTQDLERKVATRTRELIETNERLRAEIAERARVQVELNRSRQRLEQAQALARIGHVEIDYTSGRRFWSAEMFRLHGFEPAAEPPSRAEFLARVHNEDRERVQRTLASLDLGEGGQSRDYRMQLPDGSVRWLRVFGEVERTPEGRPLRLAATVQDVTPQKTVEAELLRALEQERELRQLKTDFLNMITHEYRTPLGIVMSSAEILERYHDRLPAAERLSHLGEIRRQAKLLGELVDEVLFLGRAEAGRIEFDPRPVDIPGLIRSLVSECVAAHGDPREVRLEMPPSPWKQPVDERLVRHILANLVGNALKYSRRETPVHVHAGVEAGRLELRVRDQGIGIPKDDQAKLFLEFHRARNVGAISGSGLGLVVVKRCVDLHGGDIGICSAEGVGTEFTVSLPLGPAAD